MLVTIMTDASWDSNYKVAGYGYWIASRRGKEGGGGAIGVATHSSNCAEMMGIGNALYHALKSGLVREGDEILFQTDSAHAIRAFSGVPQSTTARQREVVEYVNKLKRKYNLTVRFRHVKAHSNVKDNRSIANSMCDIRAKEAMRTARSAIKAKEIQELL